MTTTVTIDINELRSELARVGAGRLDVELIDGAIAISDICGSFTPKSDILDRLAQLKTGGARGKKWDAIYDCFED